MADYECEYGMCDADRKELCDCGQVDPKILERLIQDRRHR